MPIKLVVSKFHTGSDEALQGYTRSHRSGKRGGGSTASWDLALPWPPQSPLPSPQFSFGSTQSSHPTGVEYSLNISTPKNIF